MLFLRYVRLRFRMSGFGIGLVHGSQQGVLHHLLWSIALVQDYPDSLSLFLAITFGHCCIRIVFISRTGVLIVCSSEEHRMSAGDRWLLVFHFNMPKFSPAKVLRKFLFLIITPILANEACLLCPPISYNFGKFLLTRYSNHE